MSKNKVAFLKGRLLSANKNNLKSFQKAWMAGKKACSPKNTFALDMQTN